MKTAPATRDRLASDSRSRTRCSGAIRFASAIASASVRVTTIAPFARSDCSTTRRPRLARSTAAATRAARARDDDHFGRPGIEIDRAVAGDDRLGRGDVAAAGADDLVDARDRVGAV